MVLSFLFQNPQLVVVVGVLVAVPVVVWLALGGASTAPCKGTRTFHRLKSKLPIFGDTLAQLANVTRFHDWIYDFCSEVQGAPVLLQTWGRPDLVVLCSPLAFDECLKNQFEAFPKGTFQCENLEGVLGDGIFAVDHSKWVHQRKTASNLFSARAIREGMAHTVRTHTATLRQIVQRASGRGEVVDLFKLFNRLTIEAFAEIGFGIRMNCLDVEQEHPFQTAFDSAQRAIVLRFVRPTPFWKLQRFLGVGLEGQLQRDVKTIDDTVLDIIAKSLARRQGKSSGGNDPGSHEAKDIVSLFLDNYENSPEGENKKPFDPKYLRDIVVNFLIAGRDTTAQALSWFFLSVSQNPRVASKIRDELREYLPGLFDGSLATPSMEQVAQLTYLEAALKETLRLYPSVPFTTKHAQHDIVLSDGTFIRKNQTVGLPSWAMGRMKHVWGDDAAEFKPERFIDSATGKGINFSATKFVAFNAGPRICLGMNLAMMEMKIVVASLLSVFDIEVLEPAKVTYDFSVTLPVSGELRARVTAAATSPS